ncbi:MAG TPA: hypothetical protein VGE55_03400 [Limnobacter sp.]|uniref:hypothetical protein n=1 Tax=Limnobacter sp. TaxID=2003368 RepID=UPI002EDAE8F8
MNSTVVLALSILFAVLAFLMLCMCLYSNIRPRYKLLLVVAVSAAYFEGYGLLKNSQGWASADDLPPRFVLLATVIEEPNKNKEKGEIFVWVQEIAGNRPAGEPRAYRFAYEKGLHSLFSEAMKKARNGNSQMGTVKPRKGPKGNNFLSGNAAAEADRIRLSDLPSPQLPEK